MVNTETPPEELPDILDAVPNFDAREWIGTAKIFSLSTMPLHVLAEKQKQLVIPESHLWRRRSMSNLTKNSTRDIDNHHMLNSLCRFLIYNLFPTVFLLTRSFLAACPLILGL